MAHLYKGKDRRMITKAIKVLSAIIERDVVAADTTKKTTSISTRLPILDYDSIAGGLLFAANQLIGALTEDLAATPSMAPAPGRMNPSLTKAQGTSAHF
jgi:hypothetical protein